VIRDLVSAGVKVQVNTTVMAGNVDELADIATLVAGTGTQMWEVFFLVQVGRGQAAGAISAAEHGGVCHFLYDASRYGFVVRTVEAPFFRCGYADLCGGSRARAYAATGDPLGEDPACAYRPHTRPAGARVTGAWRRSAGRPNP
jgi:MoaA/NifB/PqqE/SkfB family radical SAM enzyme